MVRKDYTADDRASLLELVTARGMSVVAAARQLGITTSTAGNWVRKAKSASASLVRPGARLPAPSTFARLVRGSEPLEVVVGRASIRIQRGFDPALLRAVVDALTEATP